MLIELLASSVPLALGALRVTRRGMALARVLQRRHELAAEHARQGVHWKQELWRSAWNPPLSVSGERAARHDAMHVQMPLQALRPGMQHQGQCRGAAQPLRIGGKLLQRLCGAGKQRVDDPVRMRAVQRVQRVWQGEHQVRIRHR